MTSCQLTTTGAVARLRRGRALPRASADAAAARVQATKPRIIAPLMRVLDAAL